MTEIQAELRSRRRRVLSTATVRRDVLERLLLGPALANYATLELGAGYARIAAVLVGLLVAGAFAVLWVTRQTTRATVVKELAGA